MTTLIRYWGSHLKSMRHAESIALDFAPMVARNWSCHLVMERLPEDKRWLTPLVSLPVTIHLRPRPKWKFDPKNIMGVYRLCRELNPDVFICENIHDSPLVGSALARVPVRIWIKHAMNASFEEKARPSFKDRLAPTTRLSCLLATRVMTVSGAVGRELLELGVASHKVMVRPNPRRLGQLPNRESRDAVRSRLGFAPTDIIWISVGHAVAVKGWDMLIRAIRMTADHSPRARLLLVGGIDRPEELALAEELRRLIARLNLTDRVVFTGHVGNIAELLLAADGFAMPSRSEGFSLSLIEAMEARLPCVATRVGIAPEVVEPETNGFLVDRFDEAGFARGLTELTCNDRLRSSFSAHAAVPDAIPTPDRYAERLMEDCLALSGS